MTTEQSATGDDMIDELLTDFLDESSQLLDRLNEDLLVLDEWLGSLNDAPGRCDDALMNNMFRSAHSIKGLSAMLGLSNINRLTHRVENIFDAARKDELPLNRQVVQVIFEAIDHLSAMVGVLRSEGHDEHDAGDVIDAIQEILQSAGCERKATSQSDAEKALADLGSPDSAPASLAPPEISATSPSRSEPVNTIAPSIATDHFAGVTDEAEVPAKYLAIFIDETEMSLDSIGETLMSLETMERKAAIENLLITSHRIKGSAASVGLHRPAKLAHLMEDILQELRETQGTLSAVMVDAMLQCTDALRAYVAGLRSGTPESSGFSVLANELLAANFASHPVPAPSPPVVCVSAQQAAPSATVTPAATKAVEVSPLLREIAARYQGPASLIVGRITFLPGLALAGLKARLIYEKLVHVGELLECSPSIDDCDEIDHLPELTFALATELSTNSIKSKVFVAGVANVELLQTTRPGEVTDSSPVKANVKANAQIAAQPVPSVVSPTASPKSEKVSVTADNEPAEGAAKGRAAGDATNKPNETLRVDIERLDQLMNLAGQLVINKARFAQIGEGLKETMVSKQTPQLVANVANLSRKLLQEAERVNTDGKVSSELEAIRSHARRLQSSLEVLQREVSRLTQQRAKVNDLFEAVHQLDRVADGIQKSVMDTRMVPIGPLFGRFKRVVRDITRLNNKDINLVIRGEKTELDKRMIDELGDPLIHMVRNAADHGIESPAERAAVGKPAQGTLTLDAFHRGNSIIIQVVDDGKGLDKDRILAKAIEKKLISAAEAEKMTPQQAYQLIWEPGFSTAEKITEISGRGMGMDIVRSKIEEISGTVEVDSRPGQGTTFTIKLPLTLAILPSLMADIEGDVFALPVESIVEIVSVPQDQLKTVHGSKTAVIRGRVVSIVELPEIFTWSVSAKSAGKERNETTLVILGQEGAEIGLRVDVLLGEEDVVIKSMAENYRNVAGIAGASILGDGRVSLILDTTAMIATSSRQPLLTYLATMVDSTLMPKLLGS